MTAEKEWLVRASAADVHQSETTAALAQALQLSLPTAQLLINRGYESPQAAYDFLAKRSELFHDPFLMQDMRKAAETILQSVTDGRRIAIYGDYDVDGVTSVCILYLYLKKLGADVTYYIPCRLGEGYGMSEEAVRRLAADGVQTIITVDTGVTAVAEAQLASELGVTLVITDHHECSSQLPVAEAIVNPHRPDDSYPFADLAGVGVVFKLLSAMEILRCPALSVSECVRHICMEYADLVAIGTVADVMPIRDENRLLVALGLKRIEAEPREGVRALLAASLSESRSTQRKKITSSLIGFTLAPRINAAGRIEDAAIAVQLFLSEDAETANSLAHRLCDINRQRQNEENRIADAAYARIDAEYDLTRYPVIVLADDHWHHGVIGIVASRITERYGCPCILISFEQTGQQENVQKEPHPGDLGKGSGRSVKGMNLVDALSSCSELLVKYGGHELAAGLTIERSQLAEFRERINEFARSCFHDGMPLPTLEADCELTGEDITMRQAEELYSLEPYGTSNPTPVFVTYAMTIADITAVGAGKHIRFRLEKDGVSVTAMYFRHGLADIDAYPGEQIDVMYQLDVNEFQGVRSLQMILKDIRLSEDIRRREQEEHRMYHDAQTCIRERKALMPEMVSDVLPARSDFASVYHVLRHEISLGHEVFSIRALRHLLRASGVCIGYVKLKYVLSVFQELRILSVEEPDEEREIYHFRLVCTQEKTSLDRSVILQRLRACAEQQ